VVGSNKISTYNTEGNYYGSHKSGNTKEESQVNTGTVVCNIPGMLDTRSTCKSNTRTEWSEAMGFCSHTQEGQRGSIGISCQSKEERQEEVCCFNRRDESVNERTKRDQGCTGYSRLRTVLVKKKDELGLKGPLLGHFPRKTQQEVIAVIKETIVLGLTQKEACRIFDIGQRKFRRWCCYKEKAKRTAWNRITDTEREAITSSVFEPSLIGKPLSHVFVFGHEHHRFYTSLSTVYRVLSSNNLVKPIKQRRKIGSHVSIRSLLDTGFYILCYDGTAMRTDIGLIVWAIPVIILPFRFVLYIGHRIGSFSSDDIVKTIDEAIVNIPDHVWNMLVSFSDRGSPMKAVKTRSFLESIGIPVHFGRPHTPEDQAWIESLIKDLKYHRDTPYSFPQVADIIDWLRKYPGIKNNEPHSALHYVTPAQAIAGDMEVILAQRKANISQAKAKRLSVFYANKYAKLLVV